MTGPLDTLKIDTPENVSFSYDVAGIGSRFLAALVDTLLLGLLQVIVIGTIILILIETEQGQARNPLLSSSGGAAPWIFGILGFISFLFFWGYYIFFEVLWNGQTPGKRWVGLRVIRMDGTPVTLTEVVIRNLVRTLDLLPAAYGVGVVTMFINSNSCRLGDLAARTVVVHDRPAAMPESTLGSRVEASNMEEHLRTAEPLPPGFPLGKIRDQDIQVIESFLARRSQLPNRQELAKYILRSLYTRIGRDPARTLFESDPEQALATIRQAKQDLHGK